MGMTLLQIHVALSLIGIVSGLVVFYGLLTTRSLGGWTAFFLVTTILTSASGFPLPPFGFDPPRAVGVISLVLLAIAVVALYAFKLKSAWRWLYVITAIAALWFNVFVLIIQSFAKIPALHAIAPTLSDPAFVAAELVVLAIFGVLGIVALIRFHPQT
jgi:hypothetical protein